MAKRQEGELEKNRIARLYQAGLDYQNRIGLRRKIPMYVDFYEGKQWPSSTESTKNLPRPVINIVKMICRSKKSAILATPAKIIYKSYSPKTNVERLRSFAESVLCELGQDMLDKNAIDDGVKKGSYFYHYYWDKDAIGLNGEIEGGVRCELIDPLNIFFENPSELDEQRQKWIIISTRMDVESARALCDSDVDKSLVLPDDSLDEYGEDKEDGRVTVLTRYFRENGEVLCERATEKVVINKPFSITPNLSEFEGECACFTKKRRATLYPVVAGYYERRQGCIYGLSEVEGIIPNQKAINFNIAMSLFNAQQCAWGKYIAMPNALKGQKISNVPGQVLIDHSGTGEGIKKMPEQILNEVPMRLSEAIVELTKNTTGASEVFTGEAYASLSGAAISQLQAQAQVPIEDLKSTFYNVKRKQGLVLLQFLRLYYCQREFIKKCVDENGSAYEVTDVFSSRDYENSVFSVSVEALGGSRASVASDISLLETCLKNGSISIETFINAYPSSAISNKDELLRQIKKERESELTRLKERLRKYEEVKE